MYNPPTTKQGGAVGQSPNATINNSRSGTPTTGR